MTDAPSPRCSSASDYADLVRELHQAAEEHDRGHGPLHAAAANAIDHLMTLIRLMQPGGPAQGVPDYGALTRYGLASKFQNVCALNLSHSEDGEIIGVGKASYEFADWVLSLPSTTCATPPDWKQDQAETSRLPKVRTSHHRNKEEAARLQALVNKRLCSCKASERDGQHMGWCPVSSTHEGGNK